METSQTVRHVYKKTGYPLVTRDAAPMLDDLIHTLTASGNGFALINTVFRFGQTDIKIKPAKADRDIVFEAAREAFKAGGWHYSSVLADPADEASRPVTEMTFHHPRMNTRIGKPLPNRPARLGFDVNLPDSSLPLTRELIDYYAAYASEIARSLLEEQAGKERLFQPIPLQDASLDEDADKDD